MAAFALLAAGLTGCAQTSGTYPSLAIRDAERVSGSFAAPATPAPPAEPAPPPSPSADVLGRLDALQAAAQRANSQFGEAQQRARSAVAAARGTAPGSENYSVAQVALAALDSSRSEAMVALADLDRLYIDAELETGQADRIEQVRSQVAGIVEEQSAEIDNLYGQLSAPGG